MKTSVFLLLLFFSVKTFGQLSSNGLVSSYFFTGNANDTGTNGNHGVVHGATLTVDRFNNPNCAYSFDGNDYISVDNAVGINNATYSYSVWVKADRTLSSNDAMQIFEFGTSVNNIYGQLLSMNESYVGASGWTVSSGSTNGNHTILDDQTSPSTDRWYNIVLTRSSSYLSLYVDGTLTKKVSVAGLTTYYNSPLQMYIGTRAQFFQYWTGEIDDIAIYNRELTPQEIHNIVNAPNCSSASKNANFWYFGINAGIDFNSGTAVALTNGQLNTREGASTISDNNGQLLFYTDGISVWNKNHGVMETGLFGNPSSTQSAVIIPNPADPSKYYIFTADYVNGFNGYCYSEVDMTLNSGLGDVIPASKNTLLFANHTEKITATKHANGTDFWVILHENNNSNFRAYLINGSGISAPVISTAGSITDADIPGSNSIGYMKFNNAGDKLIDVYNGLNYSSEIFNFNTTTGSITGPSVTISPLSACYGAEFSKSGKYVYISELQRSSAMAPGYNNKGAIAQYNLLAGSNSAINASRVELITSSTIGYGALQMAPDGKIYAAKENGFYNGVNYLGVINNPEAQGVSSNYVENGFYLAGRQTLIGLPNFIPSNYTNNTIKISGPQSLCLNDTASYTVSPSQNLTFHWSTGNFSLISTTNSGITVKFNAPGSIKIKTETIGCPQTSSDSMNVTVISPVPFDINLSDVLVCPNASVVLDAGAGFDSYLWQDGSNLSTFTTTHAGQYYVSVTQGCAKAKDTVTVSYYTGINPQIQNLQPSYCISDEEVQLTASPAGGLFGGSIVTGSSIHLKDLNTGSYTISYTYNDINNCPRSSYAEVQITSDCLFIPNLITPNNDGQNEVFQITGLGTDYTLEIYNRWGDCIYKKEKYNNTFDGKEVQDGVYFYECYHPQKEKRYNGWLQIVDNNK